MVRQRSAKPLYSGSNPEAAFFYCQLFPEDLLFDAGFKKMINYAGVAELADARDLKSLGE